MEKTMLYYKSEFEKFYAREAEQRVGERGVCN